MSNDVSVLLRGDHREVRRLFREYRALADGEDGAGGEDGADGPDGSDGWVPTASPPHSSGDATGRGRGRPELGRTVRRPGP